MKTIKVSEATNAQLAWLVAKCENKLWLAYENALNNGSPLPVRPSEFLRDNNWSVEFSPATNWAQGGPIVEREKICTYINDNTLYGVPVGGWSSGCEDLGYSVTGPTPLIVAMRCYVASKMGDEVEIPEELM